MGFFDFLWLTSEERNIIKKRRAEQLLKEYREEERPALPAPAVAKQEGPKKVYEKIYFAGGSTTVVLPDGISLTKENTDVAFLQQVKEAADEAAILQLFQMPTNFPIEEEDTTETPEERELVAQNLDILENHEDFIVKDKDVYMKGVKLALPAAVIAGFIEILEKLDAVGDDWDDDWDDVFGDGTDKWDDDEEELQAQYQSLKMFWLKLATSPRKESRDQVLTFCRKNDVRLSKTGNIIAYRRIVEYDKKDDRLNKFVQASWDKVKGWKKNPANFVVCKDELGDFFVVDTTRADYPQEQFVDNLQSLRDKPVDPVQLYTSSHNRGKYTFKIGDVYKIHEDDINVDAGLCAAGGLHFGACSYNYSGYGDTPVVVLVNPAKTITIPRGETSKGRTVEMKIALINPNPHGMHIDEDLIEAADQEYNTHTLEQLQQVLETKTWDALEIDGEVPNISLKDVARIKEMLQQRITEIS